MMDFGNCERCDYPLQPVPFKEYEYDKHNRPTGRIRIGIDYLICDCCGKRVCTDGSVALSDWFFKEKTKR